MISSDSAEFVFLRTYARWIESETRRETWPETVERYVTFIKQELGDKVPPKVLRKIHEKILALEVMPSMRTMWAAGSAAKKDNTTMYNCSFAGIDSTRVFSEMFYILMCGVGFGFSVESKYIEKLSSVPTINQDSKIGHSVDDSREGWADSIKLLMDSLYEGKDIDFDYSKIRPKGSRLVTMGGRASGPAPLITLHSFIKEVFYKAQGRKLTSLECHDIANQIADSVVVGGVRRSSQISLSDLNDEELRSAKTGNFPPRRYMANNSAVYYKKPTAVEFLKEWGALASSGTGERGICNLFAMRKNAPSRRNSDLIAGGNPCFEIMLRDSQFCNLSEVVIRQDDDLDSLLEKVETATWIGAIQSCFTNFPYLSKKWKKNCEEERLLGVSLTGQLDNPEALTADALKAMKARALKTAKKASEILNINMPTAVTTTKPSGTVSQLVDSSSGIHPRYAKYYIRRYRISATDPLYKLMKDQGIKMVPENGQENLKDKDVSTWIVSFPIKAPDNCITRHDFDAIKQLEWYKKIQKNWCEHNASMTVYVKDEEWFEVGNWVYKNWDIVNGISFLPFDGGVYKNAPYEEISEKTYVELLKSYKKPDYSKLPQYETEDVTEGSKQMACSGDRCEIT